MSLHTTNCVISYDIWPSTGTVVDNSIGTAAYDGTANEDASNFYSLLTTTATSFSMTAEVIGCVTITKGTAINNMGKLTFEFMLYPTSVTGTQALYVKTSAWNGIYVGLLGTHLRIFRADNGGSAAYKQWDANDITLAINNWYDIQISWDSTSVSNTPVVHINKTASTLTYSGTGTTDAWYDDSGYNVQLCRKDASSYPFAGKIALFRLHSDNLSSAYLDDNYEADKWRMGVITPPCPGATADDCAVTSAITISMTCPGATADDCAVTSAITRSMTCPGAIADDCAVTSAITRSMTCPGAIADDAEVTAVIGVVIPLTAPSAEAAPQSVTINYTIAPTIEYAEWPTTGLIVINTGGALTTYNGVCSE